MTSKKTLLEFLEGIENFRIFENKLSKIEETSIKGDLFELFCQAYLVTIYPEDFKSVKLFKNIDYSILDKLNLRFGKDYGIDLIAVTKSGEIWTIQAKFRTSNTITWKELSTFFSSSENANFKLVMGNLNQIKHHPFKIIPKFSSILRFDFDRLDEEDFKRIRNYLGAREKIKPFEPKPHQEKAIEKAVKHFKRYDKGQMIHACGTGKTLTSLWIKEKLKPKNTICFVPSLSLLKQTLEEWFKHKKDKFSIKCVCSDPTVTKGRDEADEPIIDLTELGVPVTTDDKEVVELYLFSWDDVPGNDSMRILKYMRDNLKIDWAENAEIKKSDNSEAITLTKGENSLIFKLNKEENKVNLEISGGETYEYILKKEKGKLNIYVEFLKDKSTDKVIFSTYQSAQVILDAVEKLDNFSFDFGVFDEAHRTATRSNKLFGLCLDVPIKKKMFMTATPKIYTPHLKKRAKEEDIELCSMDDENVYGTIFDEIKFGEAIKLDLLSDYKIKIIVVSDEDVKELIDRKYWLEVSNKDMTADDLAKIWALIQSMSDVDHVISFHSRIKYAKDFKEDLRKTLNLLERKNKKTRDIKSYHISGKFPAFKRSNILMEFINDEKSLVTNARCLTEGVDVPAVDGIYFVDPKRNLIDIVQATGRAIRKKKNPRTKYGHIIIPVFIGDEEDLDEVISGSAFEQVWKVVQAMKDQDEKLQQVIENMQILKGKKKIGSLNSREIEEYGKLKKDLHNIFDMEDSILPTRFNFNEFLDKVTVRTIDVVGQSWDWWYGQLKAFLERYDKYPVYTSKNNEEKRLATWCVTQRKYYREGILQKYPDRIKKLEEINFDWNPNTLLGWEENYERLKKFLENKNRMPKLSSKNEEEKRLCAWCNSQKRFYLEGNLQKYPDRIKKLEKVNFEFGGKREAYTIGSWEENYEKLKEFLEKNKKYPTVTTSKNEKEKKLATWFGLQRSSYKKGTLQKYPDRIKKLEEINFDWNPYTMGLWGAKYWRLKTFLEMYNRYPTFAGKYEEEGMLFKWCTNQRNSYKLKIYK